LENRSGSRQISRIQINGAPGTIFYLEGFHVDPVYLQDQRGYSRITLSNTNQYVNRCAPIRVTAFFCRKSII
jgi:hypothetical protein